MWDADTSLSHCGKLSLVQSRYICPGNKSTWRRKSWFVPGGVWRVQVVGCWSQSNKVTQLLTDRYVWLVARLDSVDLGLEAPKVTRHPHSHQRKCRMQVWPPFHSLKEQPA